MTTSELKNKNLDLEGDKDDSKSNSNSKPESGRSSPFIRNAHQKQHHRHQHPEIDTDTHNDAHPNTDGTTDGELTDEDPHQGPKNGHLPDSPKARKKHNTHLGRKIQHGLRKSSSRSTGLPLDCYIGLAFRVLRTREEIEAYREQVGGDSKSRVDLEKGEELLVWQAVVSDGKCSHAGCLSWGSVLVECLS